MIFWLVSLIPNWSALTWITFFVGLFVVTLITLRILLELTQQRHTSWSSKLEGVRYYEAGKESVLDVKKPQLLYSDPTVNLSVIIPAYNEEDRILKTLKETIPFLHERKKRDPKFTYEVIMIDDGSKDDTVGAFNKYCITQAPEAHLMRCIKLKNNVGKGGAVRRGMMFSNGSYLLMMDADGATRFSDLETVQTKLIKDGKVGIAVGSRAHLQSEAVAKRKWYRNILMYVFHILVFVLGGVRGIKDTQCGFKLFTRKAALSTFPSLHIERWAFDVELLLIAQQTGIPVIEVPVNWEEIPGSKIDLFTGSLEMLRDMFLIRLNYLFGVWALVSEEDLKKNQ